MGRRVLPDSCRARVSIEAATRSSWCVFIGLDGEHVGMSTFGSSAPIKQLQKDFGFTVEHVLSTAIRVMDKRPQSLDCSHILVFSFGRKFHCSYAFLTMRVR